MNVKLLTKEEEFYLFERYHKQKCLRARDKIIKHNIRLAYSVAHKFKFNPARTQKDDVLSYAMLGLIEAVKAFNYKLGIRFSTYAFTSIKNRVISSFSDYEGIIRIPGSYLKKLKADKIIDKEEKRKIVFNLSTPIDIYGETDDGLALIDTIESGVVSSDAYATHNSTENFLHKILDRDCSTNEAIVMKLALQGNRITDIAHQLNFTIQATGSYQLRALRKLQTAVKSYQILSTIKSNNQGVLV